jgi:hypothetical protein
MTPRAKRELFENVQPEALAQAVQKETRVGEEPDNERKID